MYDCQSGKKKKRIKKGVGGQKKTPWFVFTTETWICQPGSEITTALHPQRDVENLTGTYFFNYKHFYNEN